MYSRGGRDDVDIATYCLELSDMNTPHRSMEQRYFIRRYKFGVFNLFLFDSK